MGSKYYLVFSRVLLTLAFDLVIVFLCLYFFLPDNFLPNDFDKLAVIISGITAPLIAIAAAILTFLAFKMQVDVNKKIQRQIKLQEIANNEIQKQNQQQNQQFRLLQFESQFYELLRLHKENVNEMVIQGYVFEGINKIEREIGGRKIFVSNVTEFLSLVKIISGHIEEKKSNSTFVLNDRYVIAIAYYIFFFGLDSFKRHIENNWNPITKKTIKEDKKKCLTQMVNCISAFQDRHKNAGTGRYSCSKISEVKMYFKYKPYSGHLSRYGHYYRNLILIVKHIVGNKIGLTYGEERNYLRILRAQLTPHEQFLLFLNWYSGIGSQWEEDSKDGNKFFTEYRMIHNINTDVIEDSSFNWEGIIGSKFENRLDFKYLNNRDKELFEVIEGFISTQEKKTE
ncbi:putative phage abortive infection protein [Myroides sp. M-43]|uniref:putative phage abortive infection protein n=1 Tax=Myroides oncorhynchi TaxID=2893756 RepID=UPI001E593A52|nr:putative phage abortive infection protein [Myroides oncorhynchi]MCC9043715.1 putative phage abortive infection protein [Myroides oncorhynchi]